MPAIFIIAFLGFLVLVALLVLVLVVFGGARPSRRSTTDYTPSGGGSDFTSMNP
jgi:hypothetical protein